MIHLCKIHMMTVVLHTKLSHTIIDKIRWAKLFSVSIGSYKRNNNEFKAYINGLAYDWNESIRYIRTSMEHDNFILPTIPPEEVGSNKSYTPTSESESYKIVGMRIKWMKWARHNSKSDKTFSTSIQKKRCLARLLRET